MQNDDGKEGCDTLNDVQTVEVDQSNSTQPSSPGVEKAKVLAQIQQNFMELSASEEEEVSEVNIII